ncbi:hypothetical protein OCU04_012779 [Sclerotinia nivalis]|uniref:Uncharacterized protein n=1 Tax=Sclerotinia nivalis TaxID=352851 RepID=A0A9X0A9P8_9HELO|nr:hypothetical protein OCU04_012779 [Sclerotinia nivalis]
MDSDSGSVQSLGDWSFYLPDYDSSSSVSQQDCLDALRGEAIPKNFAKDNNTARRRIISCMVHGLRYNEAFAESESMKEICDKSRNKILARARNARLIMSNKIPLMTDDKEKPYCFWHPQVATIDTYRELVQKYPDMRYHVGRACAVGGYVDLYRELDLLPDISIAEEARDNLDVVGLKEIFDLITCQPKLYAVLNDYTRECNWEDPRVATGLNGDTAVLSSLDVTFEFWERWPKEDSHYFDITEDNSIGESSSPQTHIRPLAPEHVSLLYNPLPVNLPTTNKDALILHAAYEGNIDRYARLRRPVNIHHTEADAVMRGAYHHTAFARWLVDQPLSYFDVFDRKHIREAIMARFIMVNDLTRLGQLPLPFMIWYPLIPQQKTLRELMRRKPYIHIQIAITCIVADYRSLWDDLKPEPNSLLYEQATRGGRDRNYYVEDLERRAAEKDIDLCGPYMALRMEDLSVCLDIIKEPTSIYLKSSISIDYHVLGFGYYDGIYPGGTYVDLATWELSIAVSDDIREKARVENVDGCLHQNWGWPYSVWDVRPDDDPLPKPK